MHILDGMRRLGSVRAFVLMLQNEPLTDHNLAGRVRQAKQALGRRASLITVTNGWLLTPRLVDELLDAGLDEIWVSIDAVSEKTHRTVRRGLDFAEVVNNVHSLLRCKGRTRVMVRFLKQRANEGEEREFARYWRSHGAQVEVHRMSNRAGTLPGFESLRRRRELTLRDGLNRLTGSFCLACTVPFLRLAILWDGRATACCQDWEHRVVVGDLSTQSPTEFWNGEPMNHYRHLLWTRRHGENPLCRDCSIIRRIQGTARFGGGLRSRWRGHRAAGPRRAKRDDSRPDCG